MWETAKFNTRLQVTELGLGNSATDASVWKTNYEYGELQTNGAVDGAKNTGNIARQTLSFDGLAQPFVVSYKYDSLYRLTEAVEKTGSTANWSQQFGYDRYGNRTGINQAIGSLTLNKTPAVDAATNRFTSGQGFVYDKNGNVVGDTDINSSLPRQFTFNGDNKQTEVKKDGVTVGRYFYDGEGKRIKKITDTETTTFVYSAGKLIAEYSSEIASVNDAKVAYLTNDHLGSPRITTDATGQVISRHDYHPFGEEIGTLNGGSPHRTTALNYTTDSVRQKFTGYERDNESELDFAQARYYNSQHGRFTTTDPLLASAKPATPQTWNRFVYVRNNPLKFVDPTGLCEAPSGLKAGQVGICFEAFIGARRIGVGGLGHGDNRTFAGNDPSKTARVMVLAIVSTDETSYSAAITEKRVSPSLIGGGPTDAWTVAKTGVTESPPQSLQGGADASIRTSNNQMVKGEKDFGKGIDVTVGIANGTNGGQQLGQDLQATGAVMAGTGSPGAGTVVAGAGKAVEAMSPAGTIDGNMTIRIAGNGQVQYVGGAVKDYPSYALYTYQVGSNGSIQTTRVREISEGTIDELTKPMKRVP